MKRAGYSRAEAENPRLFSLRIPVTRFVDELFALVGHTGEGCEIFLVNDKTMGKNVLAYPAPEAFPRPDFKAVWRGAIYINPDFIKKHNEDFAYMLIHGVLHLLGYDHKKKNDTLRMEARENALLKETSSSRSRAIIVALLKKI